MAVIEAPKLPPIKHVKTKKYCYLVTFSNKWDAASKMSRAVKGDTKTVGKIVGGGTTGVVEWKPEFIEKFPELENLITTRVEKTKGRVKGKKSYMFTFKPADDEMMSVQQHVNSKLYMAGHIWALEQLIADTPLAKALRDVFSPYNVNRKVLSVAMFMYLNNTSAVEGYQNYAELNKMPWFRPMKPGQISKLFKSITPEKIDKFLERLNYYTSQEEQDNAGRVNTYYALDSTSISTYAKNLSKADWGHNKDGDPLKQINVLMLVNQETGIPLYYRAYNGEVPDVCTISMTLKEQARLGTNRQAVLVCDRGYCSVKNIHQLCQTNTSFLMNFKATLTLAKTIVTEHKAKLESADSYILELEQNAYTVTYDWQYPVNYSHNCKRTPKDKIPLHFHIFYDRKIKNREDENLTKTMASVMDKLRKGEELTTANDIWIRDKFLIVERDENGRLLSVHENASKRAEYLFMSGIQILVSDTVADAKEARRAYGLRMKVEQAFLDFKQTNGGYRLRSSTNSTVEGKLFTLFLATSLSTMLRCRLKQCRDKGFLLPDEGELMILNKLCGIRATVWGDGMYYSEVVGQRRRLLEAMDMPLPEAERFTEAEAVDAEEEAGAQEEMEEATMIEELAAQLAEYDA